MMWRLRAAIAAFKNPQLLHDGCELQRMRLNLGRRGCVAIMYIRRGPARGLPIPYVHYLDAADSLRAMRLTGRL